MNNVIFSPDPLILPTDQLLTRSLGDDENGLLSFSRPASLFRRPFAVPAFSSPPGPFLRPCGFHPVTASE